MQVEDADRVALVDVGRRQPQAEEQEQGDADEGDGAEHPSGVGAGGAHRAMARSLAAGTHLSVVPVTRSPIRR